MKQHLRENLKDAKTLDEVCKQMNVAFAEVKEDTSADRIGYVAGIIFSDGPEFVERNLHLLVKYTEDVQKTYSFPIFSAVDVFYEGLYEKIQESKFPYDQRRILFTEFWRKVLSSGNITDIFMTPRWEKSEGATDEHETAKKLDLAIHYL